MTALTILAVWLPLSALLAVAVGRVMTLNDRPIDPADVQAARRRHPSRLP